MGKLALFLVFCSSIGFAQTQEETIPTELNLLDKQIADDVVYKEFTERDAKSAKAVSKHRLKIQLKEIEFEIIHNATLIEHYESIGDATLKTLIPGLKSDIKRLYGLKRKYLARQKKLR